MSAKTCPRCGLVNPATATHCDCGYDLNSQGQDGVRRQTLRTARRSMAFGIALMVVAVLITLATLGASEGQSYIVWGGLFATGAAAFGRGYAIRSRFPD